VALPQRHRLRGARVFEQLYRRGRRYESPLLVLRVMAADETLLPPEQRRHPASSWRCAVVVSTKVSKRAVQRNRLRRLLHGHLLACSPESATPTPRWLLISLRPGSQAAEPDLLLGECTDLLRRAGLTP
jgi:ribonuclease P protein component